MYFILTTTDLTKGWGAVQAVQKVNLKFEKDCRHAIIWPNGAGKTTLLHLLAGALTADQGRVSYNGQDITALSQTQRVRKGIVRSFQHRRLHPEYKDHGSVLMYLEHQR